MLIIAGSGMNKFEANAIYDKILKVIKSQSTIKELAMSVKNKLSGLYNAVNNLQKTVSKRQSDTSTIKSVRDNCFSQLASLYEDIIRTSPTANELQDAQSFLLAFNEKLISALKLSRTGNDKIISRSGCVCREARCILPLCSKGCQKACSAKPKLTKYWCKAAEKDTSIPIERICNGKPDCPFEDDESQCLKGENTL
jgi:hypothetical protein